MAIFPAILVEHLPDHLRRDAKKTANMLLGQVGAWLVGVPWVTTENNPLNCETMNLDAAKFCNLNTGYRVLFFNSPP